MYSLNASIIENLLKKVKIFFKISKKIVFHGDPVPFCLFIRRKNGIYQGLSGKLTLLRNSAAPPPDRPRPIQQRGIFIGYWGLTIRLIRRFLTRMVLTICIPSVAFCTLSTDSAAALTVSSSLSTATVMVPFILPLT